MEEWLAAFRAHPKIGDPEGLKKKFGAFADMSKGEQATAAATATDEILQVLLAAVVSTSTVECVDATWIGSFGLLDAGFGSLEHQIRS